MYLYKQSLTRSFFFLLKGWNLHYSTCILVLECGLSTSLCRRSIIIIFSPLSISLYAQSTCFRFLHFSPTTFNENDPIILRGKVLTCSRKAGKILHMDQFELLTNIYTLLSPEPSSSLPIKVHFSFTCFERREVWVSYQCWVLFVTCHPYSVTMYDLQLFLTFGCNWTPVYFKISLHDKTCIPILWVYSQVPNTEST